MPYTATRAAVEEGIIPGGGVALVRACDALETLEGDNADETTGIQIVTRAVEEPLRQIVANAGNEGSVIVAKIKKERMISDTTLKKKHSKTCLKRASLIQLK